MTSSLVLFVSLVGVICLIRIQAGDGTIERHDYHSFPKDKVALHMPCEESNMFATKCMCHIKCTDKSCNNARNICKKYEKERGCKYMLMRQFGANKQVATLKRVPRKEEKKRFDISMYPKTKEALNTTYWTQLGLKRKDRSESKGKNKSKTKKTKKGTSNINEQTDSTKTTAINSNDNAANAADGAGTGRSDSSTLDVQKRGRVMIKDLVSDLGAVGRITIQRIFQPNITTTMPIHSNNDNTNRGGPLPGRNLPGKGGNPNQYCGKKYLPGTHSNSNSNSNDADRKSSTEYTNTNKSMEAFLSDGISLVVLSYHTPMTLANSMRSWEAAGLLDMVSERIALLNDPLPQEQAIALEHRFRVIQPKDIPQVKENKPNVITIGAAFYYALQAISTDYLLFLENDFKIDTELSPNEIRSQLIVAAGMLDSGAEVVRLMSRKYQGCGTFKTCDHHGIHLQSPNPGDRKRNWYAFYCPGFKHTAGYVSDCFEDPHFRCFTSWDSNWTLNAVLVKKSSMMKKKRKTPRGDMKSIAEIGLSQFKQQDGFEGVMLHSWQPWRVPICISHQGLFIHEEIETSA